MRLSFVILAAASCCVSQLTTLPSGDKYQVFTASVGKAEHLLTSVLVERECSDDHWLNAMNRPKANHDDHCVTYHAIRFGRVGAPGVVSEPYTLQLQFDFGGFCGSEPTQWTTTGELYLNLVKDSAEETFQLMDSRLCTVEIIKVSPVSAKLDDGVIVFHSPAPAVDCSAELRAIRARQSAAAARNRKLAADRKAAQAEDVSRQRQTCLSVYQHTIDRKISDLTIRETEQVQSCRALGFYPPR